MSRKQKWARAAVAAAMVGSGVLGGGGVALAGDDLPRSVPCAFGGGECSGAKGPIATQGLCQAEYFGLYTPVKQTSTGYTCLEYPANSGTWYLYTNPGRGHIPPGGARSTG